MIRHPVDEDLAHVVAPLVLGTRRPWPGWSGSAATRLEKAVVNGTRVERRVPRDVGEDIVQIIERPG